jgi:hypothetical protein
MWLGTRFPTESRGDLVDGAFGHTVYTMDTATWERRAAEAAVRAGIFTARQAALNGVDRPELQAKVARGEWVRRATGVYTPADRAPQDLDAERFAVAIYGPRVAVSHLAADGLYGLPVPDPKGVHVTVPRNVSRPPHEGITVHRRQLVVEKCPLVQGIPTTPLPRTLLDSSLLLPLEDGVALADTALRLRKIEMTELLGEARRLRHHPESPRISEFLSYLDPRSGSVPESRVRVALRRAGLPVPITQYEVFDGRRLVARVDFAWPYAKLILEVDGWRYHSDDPAFLHDRVKQNGLIHLGWRVLRVTARTSDQYLYYAVDQVRRGLGL